MTALISDARIKAIEVVPKQLFIEGQWKDNSGARTFNVHDPATEEILCSVADASPEEAMEALEAATKAQSSWAASSGRQRYEILMRLNQLLKENRERLSLMMTLEAGKPVAESAAEIDLASSFVQHFAEEALRIEGSYQVNPSGTGRMIVTKRPVGPSILITPWNFPLSMAARKISPALAAGCTVVVKPAKETPLT